MKIKDYLKKKTSVAGLDINEAEIRVAFADITVAIATPEYAIKDGHNGYVVDQNDPHVIADKIAEILSNDSLQKSMYAHGIEEAHKHTWDEIAKKLGAFYTDAIKIHAKR